MWSEKYYKKRWYDGEQEFLCVKCNERIIDYIFEDEDPSTWHTFAGDFFSKQIPPNCPKCNELMSWTGWSGDSTSSHDTITGALKMLIENNQYLPACMVFSSATEYQLNSLLYASLVDFGYPHEKATDYADGKLSNGEIVRLLRVILSRNLKTIVLPDRNSMVHGREFGNSKEYFKDKMLKMVKEVEKWINSFGFCPGFSNPTEKDRWFLFMQHWIIWCKQLIN